MIDENWQDQMQQDDETHRLEVEKVLRQYLYGQTDTKGFKILCRECGLNPKDFGVN